jgi:hypothetical protein
MTVGGLGEVKGVWRRAIEGEAVVIVGGLAEVGRDLEEDGL